MIVYFFQTSLPRKDGLYPLVALIADTKDEAFLKAKKHEQDNPQTGKLSFYFEESLDKFVDKTTV